MASQQDAFKVEQNHGKSNVRVARIWKNVDESAHDFVEWNVAIKLLSDCIPAYTHADNSPIVATDTIKNTVFVKAKSCSQVVSMEEFGIILGTHFTKIYPQVTSAVIIIVEKPWDRVVVDGQSHHHGFKLGSEKHTTKVTVDKSGAIEINSGIRELAMLKTTQSGFEKYFMDQYTTLKEAKERMLATELTASWSYELRHLSDVSSKPFCFTKKYLDVKKVLVDTFFGPAKDGVYSPSVQNTLYQMAKAVLNRFPEITSIQLNMPNLHFLPVNISKNNLSVVKCEGDVYVATSEPYGTIEATLSRNMLSKL
ncbi:Factor independent urate hydroxylase [Zostera marina]|uniref:Uricase n=1 Tax=Zostera marina TaxID=29655 RepID=A0A0K9NWH0_ZOSMR|nr:Factor independent urate hydroxylase [Zostera marina]